MSTPPIDMDMCIKSQRRDIAGYIVHQDFTRVLLDSDVSDKASFSGVSSHDSSKKVSG